MGGFVWFNLKDLRWEFLNFLQRLIALAFEDLRRGILEFVEFSWKVDNFEDLRLEFMNLLDFLEKLCALEGFMCTC